MVRHTEQLWMPRKSVRRCSERLKSLRPHTISFQCLFPRPRPRGRSLHYKGINKDNPMDAHDSGVQAARCFGGTFLKASYTTLCP